MALDLDFVPGLAVTLGVPAQEQASFSVVAERDETGWRLADDFDLDELVRCHALVAPDGVRLLQLGKVTTFRRDEELAASITACYRLLPRLREPGVLPGWTVIGDHPAGTRQTKTVWASYAAAFVVVVEATMPSVLTARRLLRLRDHFAPTLVVANKVSGPADVRFIARHLGAVPVASIPFDPAVRDADKAGAALLDHAPMSPAVAALHQVSECVDGLGARVLDAREEAGA